MKTAALFVALAVVLVAVPKTPAQPCHQPVKHDAAFVNVAPAVVLPLYGAAYTGGSGYTEQYDALRLILEELRALRADIASLKGSTVPGGALPLKGADPIAITRANCASCHSGDAEKGGGFAMFNDKQQPLKLSPADRREITKRVSNGTMPPPSKPKLSQGDKESLLAALRDAPKAPAPKEVLTAPK